MLRARLLRDDEGAAQGGESTKELGYGRPIRVTLATGEGPREVVLHTARADDFGHDRRADRAANMILAYDTFARMPGHVEALDAGFVADDGSLVSIAETNEPYLLTSWAEGALYAEDLRRVAATGEATALDLARAERLAHALVEIHREKGSHAGAYTRAIRDLLGHGEGIFGLVDSFSAEVDGVPLARLQHIEEQCLRWRWKLRGRTARLRRTHGDFHPFNLLFGEGTTLTLLDASRGGEGDPADDVACLAINYLFFGLEHRARWSTGLGRLWERFFHTYLSASGDDAVLECLAPYFAWRGLVLVSPLWYPHSTREDRARVLDFVDRALASERFEPAWGAEAMQ